MGQIGGAKVDQVAIFDNEKEKEVAELLKSATSTPSKRAMLVGLLYGLEMRVETQVDQEKTA